MVPVDNPPTHPPPPTTLTGMCGERLKTVVFRMYQFPSDFHTSMETYYGLPTYRLHLFDG